MKITFSKIISVFLIIFTIIVFFLALNIDKRYSTENILGKKIDDFEIKFLLSDQVFKKNDLINEEYYLINIWASWCLPCKKEHPILMKLGEEKNLKLIGINFKDKKLNANKFLKEMGNPYDISLIDKDGTDSVIFGVYGVPESILIDNKQKIVSKYIGPLSINDYESILKFVNEN